MISPGKRKKGGAKKTKKRGEGFSLLGKKRERNGLSIPVGREGTGGKKNHKRKGGGGEGGHTVFSNGRGGACCSILGSKGNGGKKKGKKGNDSMNQRRGRGKEKKATGLG